MSPSQIQALEALPEVMQQKYSSLEAARFNMMLIKKFNIAQDTVDDFIEARGDFILRLNTEEDFINKLKSIGLDTSAIQILNETKSNLNTANISDSVTAQKSSMVETESAVQATPLAPVKPIRTMADDIEKVHGYGTYRAEDVDNQSDATDEPVHRSTQDTVLPPKPVSAPTLTYTPNGPAAPKAEVAPTPPDTRWQSSLPPQ